MSAVLAQVFASTLTKCRRQPPMEGASSKRMGVGYFAYGLIHHAVHHWRSRSAWMQQRKRLHAIHHRLPHFNYGVTTSFWDHLFASKNA